MGHNRNFHVDMITSSLGISINDSEYDTDKCACHACIHFKFYKNSVKILAL